VAVLNVSVSQGGSNARFSAGVFASLVSTTLYVRYSLSKIMFLYLTNTSNHVVKLLLFFNCCTGVVAVCFGKSM
jgi:hypothetical protein